MFTGLVSGLGGIEAVRPVPDGVSFRISVPPDCADLAIGESLAVLGVCLTVETKGAVGKNGGGKPWCTCTAGHETLARTTLGRLARGDKVHLERALRLEDRVGGHLMTGHVDGVGRVTARKVVGVSVDLQVQAPQAVARLILNQGSIALDGVSLTVTKVTGVRFGVMLIPKTIECTILGGYQPGRQVNLEGDIIGKYVGKHLATMLGTDPAKLGGRSLAELLGDREPS